jgi:LTXXQ motif family protein
MRKFTIAGVAVLAIAGSTAVYAQYHPWIREHVQHVRMTPEDRAAFVDARIAAVHAGLKLTADQEKLWPPVEAAVRDFAKLRIDRANARMAAPQNQPQDSQKQDSQRDAQRDEDPVARLRERAQTMAANADAMKKIADAADPLYKTLDDGQKRRLAILTHHDGRFSGEGWRHRWMERGSDRDRWQGRDGDDGRGPERL